MRKTSFIRIGITLFSLVLSLFASAQELRPMADREAALYILCDRGRCGPAQRAEAGGTQRSPLDEIAANELTECHYFGETAESPSRPRPERGFCHGIVNCSRRLRTEVELIPPHGVQSTSPLSLSGSSRRTRFRLDMSEEAVVPVEISAFCQARSGGCPSALECAVEMIDSPAMLFTFFGSAPREGLGIRPQTERNAGAAR